MQERFRVALGNFKKLITVTHGITTLEELHSDIRIAFSKCPIYRQDEFVVQYFDEQFNEFIDLDDISELTLLMDKRLQVSYMDNMCELKNLSSAPMTSSITEGSATDESQISSSEGDESIQKCMDGSDETMAQTK